MGSAALGFFDSGGVGAEKIFGDRGEKDFVFHSYLAKAITANAKKGSKKKSRASYFYLGKVITTNAKKPSKRKLSLPFLPRQSNHRKCKRS